MRTQQTVVKATVPSKASGGWRCRRGNIFVEDEDDDGGGEGADHRDDFAPSRDAPPEPAEEVEETGAGSDLKDKVEAVLGGVHEIDDAGRAEEQAESHAAGGEDIMFLRGLRADEAGVEIVDEIGRLPQLRWVRMVEELAAMRPPTMELGEADGEEFEHGRVGDVVAGAGKDRGGGRRFGCNRRAWDKR